tara:strand:+ start:225 stop:428 length:204 start_codon:yes stop_codon:yes gene_type:complete
MNEKIKQKLREYDQWELAGNIRREIKTTLGTIVLPIQNMPEDFFRLKSGDEKFNLSTTVRPNDEPSL